jgi:hypothetical protein
VIRNGLLKNVRRAKGGRDAVSQEKT